MSEYLCSTSGILMLFWLCKSALFIGLCLSGSAVRYTYFGHHTFVRAERSVAACLGLSCLSSMMVPAVFLFL